MILIILNNIFAQIMQIGTADLDTPELVFVVCDICRVDQCFQLRDINTIVNT